jgi:hypothetical protein
MGFAIDKTFAISILNIYGKSMKETYLGLAENI